MLMPGWFWSAWWVLAAVAVYAIFIPPGALRRLNDASRGAGWWFYAWAMARMDEQRRRQAMHEAIVAVMVRSGDTQALLRYLNGPR